MAAGVALPPPEVLTRGLSGGRSDMRGEGRAAPLPADTAGVLSLMVLGVWWWLPFRETGDGGVGIGADAGIGSDADMPARASKRNGKVLRAVSVVA